MTRLVKILDIKRLLMEDWGWRRVAPSGRASFVIPLEHTHHSDNRLPRRWMTSQHQQVQGIRHRAARETALACRYLTA